MQGLGGNATTFRRAVSLQVRRRPAARRRRDRIRGFEGILTTPPEAARLPTCYTPPPWGFPEPASGATLQRTATTLIKLPEIFNVASIMVDRHVAEGRGAKVAIEYGEDKITYRDLLENTNRVGNLLRQLGVDSEQRVLLALLDSPEFLYYFFGAIKIGATAVPVNPWLRAQDYEYLLNDTRARVAVVSESVLPEIQKLARDRVRCLKEIVVVGRNTALANLSDLMKAASPQLQAEPTSKDDMAFWLYSSGSTGAPKGCVHLHHDMVVSSEAYAKGILRMNESDRCYSVARLFFAYGLGNAGYFPLYCGATTILSPARPTPSGHFRGY